MDRRHTSAQTGRVVSGMERRSDELTDYARRQGIGQSPLGP